MKKYEYYKENMELVFPCPVSCDSYLWERGEGENPYTCQYGCSCFSEKEMIEMIEDNKEHYEENTCLWCDKGFLTCLSHEEEEYNINGFCSEDCYEESEEY